MRILIDASMARGGGGFTYLVNILPRLSRLSPDDCLRVFVRGSDLQPLLPELDNLELVELPEAGLLGRFWSLFVEGPKRAREWRADVYYSVAEYCPFRLPCPSMVSFRNPNIFTTLDQGWPLYQRFRLGALRRLACWAASSASRVLFVSTDSANWIGDSIGLAKAKRAVVHHGVDLELWAPPTDGSASRTNDAPLAPVILSVSSVYRYKNFVRLIEAYALLVDRGVAVSDLVIVGDDQDRVYSEKMRAARDAAGPAGKRIRFIGAVPYQEILAHYRAADLFVFPSYLETFGHPLLEAMAADLPVVAADIPVFREIAGDGAIYADPHDASALASAMERVITQPDASRALRSRARLRLEEFGWDASAHTLLDVLHELAAEGES